MMYFIFLWDEKTLILTMILRSERTLKEIDSYTNVGLKTRKREKIRTKDVRYHDWRRLSPNDRGVVWRVSSWRRRQCRCVARDRTRVAVSLAGRRGDLLSRFLVSGGGGGGGYHGVSRLVDAHAGGPRRPRTIARGACRGGGAGRRRERGRG